MPVQTPKNAAPSARGVAATTCAAWVLADLGIAFELAILAGALPLAQMGWAVRVQIYALLVLAGLSWIGCQVREWSQRRHPVKARTARRCGWAVQALILLFAMWGCCTSGRADALIGLLPVALGMTPVWPWWMQEQAPRPAEQKAIAALIAEQEQDLARHLRPAASEHQWALPDGKHAPAVYFLRNGSRVKIGTTTNLRQRVRRLALRDDSIALILHGGSDVERALHQKFAELRVGNTEWFHGAKTLNDFIAAQTDRARAMTLARG